MRLALFTASLCLGAAAASAQMISVSPIPEDADARFCYYAGLAYSEAASLTLEVPDRRQGAQALQQRAFVCTRGDDGRMVWVGIDVERAGLSGN